MDKPVERVALLASKAPASTRAPEPAVTPAPPAAAPLVTLKTGDLPVAEQALSREAAKAPAEPAKAPAQPAKAAAVDADWGEPEEERAPAASPPSSTTPTGPEPSRAVSSAAPKQASAAAASSAVAWVNALKVAVVHAGGEGELRVVALAPGRAAPAGAAIAMLVPVSENDGQSLSRLLQAGSEKGERA